jgi:aspartate/glutamate racemase
MDRSFAFLHTVTGLVPTFEQLAATHLPGWKPFNIVDESLLRNTMRQGNLTPETIKRVVQYLCLAAEGGAEAVVVTCSSIGPAVEAAKPLLSIPLVRIDEGMVDVALKQGRKIGVLATVGTTLKPTSDLILDRAALQGLTPTVTARVCEGAFAQNVAGNRDRHDEIIRENIVDLGREVDVIVLAQASMARAAEHAELANFSKQILSSPEHGILHFRSVLARMAR